MTEAEVTIDRCVLRLRRANGWSWGSDPDALIRAASNALPALLAPHLHAIAARAVSDRMGTHEGARDVTIEALRLTIPITLDELIALPVSGSAGDVAASAPGMHARLTSAMAAALGGAALAIDEVEVVPAVDPPIARQIVIGERTASIARALAAWSAAGQHIPAIYRLSTEVAQAWRAELEAVRGEPSESGMEHDAPVGIDELLAARPPSVTHVWLAVVASELRTSVEHAAIVRAVARARFVVTSTDALEQAVQRGLASSIERASTPLLEETRSASTTAHATSASITTSSRALEPVDIECALPFLALVSLARIGWLATLDAAATAAGMRELLPAIACGLAYKMLPVPARGWHHSSAVHAAAAAFAAQTSAATDLLTTRIGAADDQLAEPLAATLRSALVLGHAVDAPLVVHADGRGGYHLLERDGLFALAWSEKPRRLASTCDELILVPASSATPELLDALDLGNRRFVTDAPPARGETWRRLPGGLRTNDTMLPAEKLSALARRLDESALLARELDEEIVARPALPRATTSMFERVLAQAAVLALADLSWTLFRSREVPTPVLALARFADLGAHVTFGADVVRVRLPLGRRHADLFAHHYTGEVHGVPWLDGRVVEICGG